MSAPAAANSLPLIQAIDLHNASIDLKRDLTAS
jgi:hypothetical protein